jgi:hypothetical protein
MPSQEGVHLSGLVGLRESKEPAYPLDLGSPRVSNGNFKRR